VRRHDLLIGSLNISLLRLTQNIHVQLFCTMA
jgi:hypothetical protein